MTLQNKTKAGKGISKYVLFADNNCFQLQLMTMITDIVLVFYLGAGAKYWRGKSQEVLFPISPAKLADATLKAMLKILKLAVCLLLK